MKILRQLISLFFSCLLLSFLWILSLLPLSILYILSDVLYLVIYRILKYRVTVCRNNLNNSFPEKSAAERLLIERKFYRHLSDIVVETIKSFTISENVLKKRMVLKNPELLESFFNKNISLIAVTGHYNNWEWAAMSLPFHCRHKPQGVYLAIKNHLINRFMIHSRSRFGIELIEVSRLYLEMENRKNRLTINGFIADQSPSKPNKGMWLKFLNQDTLVAAGTEKYARQYGMGVVFGKISKVKRGMYTLEYLTVCGNGAETREGEITSGHSALLEAMIREQPEYWLWSHKRWKHKKPEATSAIN